MKTQSPKNHLRNGASIITVGISAILIGCSSAENNTPERTQLIKRTIQKPAQNFKYTSQVVWYDDQSYLVLPSDSFTIYKITGNRIDSLPRTAKFLATRTNYEDGFVQNISGHPFLIDGYGGVYLISDSIKKYPLPTFSRPGIHSASLTNSGLIYACGIAGVWKAKLTDSMLSPIPKLDGYNTRGIYIDDTIGIMTRQNTITLFQNDTPTEVISFADIGLTPSTSSGFTSDWIGKMNGYYYIFQGLSGIKLSPDGKVVSVFVPPSSQIVSFTDGDCFFSKRMDLVVWCDDGKSIATFTNENSDLYDEMIFAGKNSQGYWISDGKRLLLLDLEKAKTIARNK